MKSYCLPFLLYGFEAATLSGTNACLLNACIDRAVYKHSSVTAVLLQTGLPSGVTLLHNNFRHGFNDMISKCDNAAVKSVIV